MHQVYMSKNTAITRIAAMWKTVRMLHWGEVAVVEPVEANQAVAEPVEASFA